MKKVIDSFKTLFDGIRPAVESDDSCVIVEKEKTAFLKRLDIVSKGSHFVTYNDDLPQSVKFKSSTIDAKNCDGTIFWEKPDGELALIFSDLKSSFDTKDLIKAYKQTHVSCLKAHSMLSLCEGYDMDKIQIIFLAACKTFMDKGQEDGVYQLIRRKRASDADSFEASLLPTLLRHGRVVVKMEDLPTVEAKPFCQEIRNKKVEMRLALTTEYADSAVSYTL